MIGRVVGKYRILEPIGEGGMGVVYRAEHVVLGSPAAVKILLPQFTRDSITVDRFFHEAKATGSIRHPGIVQVFDYGRLDSEQAYIAMELLRGEDLTGFLGRHGALPPSLAAQIILQLLSALEAAHLRGIVHRDLKPDNVFLVPDAGAPGGFRIKILDFGIAKLMGDQHGPRHKTRGGTILGTPAYMAPEQCKGGMEIDARTDLYAVGCILFELLTGRPPFEAEGGGAVMAMHIYVPIPSLAQRAPQVPAQLDALVTKMLAKQPAERTPSAAFALATLERVPLPPLNGSILLHGRDLTPSPMAVVSLDDPPPLPSRWLPLAVLSIALAIAAAAATIIGMS